ncbi:DNA polymerase I protein [Rhizobium phage RHph_I3_11]|nr:DNA polymerase I protein [Rhizobium phage RHph_I3_11]
MRKALSEADILIAHNIVRFDVPVFEELLGIKIKAKIVDTLALSWYLYPLRNKHGLESHGEDLGIYKPFIANWENQTQEEYEHRVEEDVKINVALWRKMWKYLFDIYGSEKEIWRLLDYLTFKMKCAHLQEVSQWKVDIPFVEKSLEELQTIQEEKTVRLSEVMPQVPSISIKTKPKRFINKDGSYSKLGQDWIRLLSDKGLPIDYDGEVEVITGYEPGNPNSTDQKKEWLYSLGWKPRTFKEVKNKETGETKSIPQINLDQGKGICDSIKELYEKEPDLELLEGLSVLQHRIGILKGFLRDQENGWIKAQISGFTNTLRVKHTTVVNLPKPEKLYAGPIRGGLVADDGFELCGSDMKSLEDRIKMHYIYPLDPKYVESMSTDDWDPHLEIGKLAGMLKQSQVDAYKAGDKSCKPIRDIAKNCGYAAQYGAGVARLMTTGGINRFNAQKMYDAYWELNWSVKKVAEDQVVKTIDGQMWQYNPVSRFWYTLRYEKDRFSTLVQGTASYVFDLWIQYVLEQREQLTACFHDEGVWHIKEGHREEFTSMINKAIDKVNEEVKLNRKLEVDIQYGYRYSSIH